MGVGSAWEPSRLIESLIFVVRARDAMVFTGAFIVLDPVRAAALAATRASHVNPVDSLLNEGVPARQYS